MTAAWRRVGDLLALLGCGLLPLALLTWVTVGNLAAGRWLLAAVVLVPLAGLLLALVEREARREARAELADLVVALLGGEVELASGPSPVGPALRVTRRRGRLRADRRPVPWSQVVEVRAGTGQGGGHHVSIEEVDGRLTFLPADDAAASEALRARLEAWRAEAEAAAPPGPRCCLCHVALGEDPARCEGCGTLSHPACRAQLGACPTLGCRAGPPPLPRDVEAVDITVRPPWGERVGAGTLVACAALSGALVTRGRGPELLAGGVLGLLCLAGLASAWTEVLEALLGARRVVARRGDEVRVRLRLGPLGLPAGRTRLAEVAGVEASEGTLGGHVVWLTLADGGRRLLARGLSAVAARRLEAAVQRWRGHPAAPGAPPAGSLAEGTAKLPAPEKGGAAPAG